jgi:mannose-6-phosphate isomerase-like protein (cupin superfamily)
MRTEQDHPLRIALQDASAQLASVPETFVALLKRGDLSVELFAPHQVDTQQPHEQDEIYIVASGGGVFRRGAERVPFGPGDLLFVAAGVSHAFERFTDDFKTWVVFFGPKGGYQASDGR